MLNKLIILCSRLNPNPKDISEIESLLDADLNWDKLIKKAAIEGVSPLLYRNLKQYHDKVPEEAMQNLRSMYLRNKAHNIYLYTKLKPFLKEINDLHLKACLSKGARLAITLYKDIGLRYFSDIDFFMHPSDWPQFKKASEKLGFQTEGYASSFPNLKMRISGWPLATALSKEKLMLDTHFNYPGIEMPMSLDNDIWESAQQANIEGINAKIFSPEYELCILCAHVQSHAYSRLSWLTDIAELSLKKNLNWHKILYICQKEELRVSVYYALYLVNCFWPHTISKDILDRFWLSKIEKKILISLWPEEKILSRDSNLNTPPLAISIFLLFSGRRFFIKAKFLLSRPFPPLNWIAWRYNVPAGSVKAFNCYLKRLVVPLEFLLRKLFKKRKQ